MDARAVEVKPPLVMRVVMWGTYDKGKPRNRILLRGLRENGVEVIECHRDVWSRVEDKSQISGAASRLRLLGRWLGSYPGLLVRYLRLPRHDIVLIGYMGQLDVLLLWPLARLRGVPVVWDAFLVLYNTVVEDRGLVGPRHPMAWLLHLWEWLAGRAADLVLLDTEAQAEYFAGRYGLAAERVAALLVGVEQDRFPPPPGELLPRREGNATVLFYGQFTPLHGIETIVRAARLAEGAPIQWLLIGKGQEEARIRAMLEKEPVARLKWIPWVPYEDLVNWIHRADVCLGIFGDSDKAARVIPNKVFQILSAGVPLITRDSPAIRELLDPDTPGVALVPCADPHALVAAVRAMLADVAERGTAQHRALAPRIGTPAVGRQLVSLLKNTQRDT